MLVSEVRSDALKVLHVVESFDGQAVESWLTRMLLRGQHIAPRVQWHFYATEPSAGRYESMIPSTITRSPVGLSSPAAFTKALRAHVAMGGYDILHCHHDVLSGLYLWAVRAVPLRGRIIHVHNTSLALPMSRAKAELLKPVLREYCLRSADLVVGVSEGARAAMVGDVARWRDRSTVLHCGIDAEILRFSATARADWRRRLNLPTDASVLLFIGRMTEYKNPGFVLDVLSRMRSSGRNAYAVFAGSGPYEKRVYDESGRLGLQDHIRILGWVSQIEGLLSTADVLLCPTRESPKEGLGLTVVEAQAAGLPVVCSLAIPAEAFLFDESVCQLPLSSGPQTWTDATTSLIGSRAREDAYRLVTKSDFGLDNSLRQLVTLYESLAPQ